MKEDIEENLTQTNHARRH